MQISIADLKRIGESPGEIQRFHDLFGEQSVTITAAWCVEHPEFDYRFLACRLFPGAILAEYKLQEDVLKDEYWCQETSFWVDYKTKRDALRVEFGIHGEPWRPGYTPVELAVWIAYDKARAGAWHEYEFQQEKLWVECERERNALFGTLAERQ